MNPNDDEFFINYDKIKKIQNELKSSLSKRSISTIKNESTDQVNFILNQDRFINKKQIRSIRTSIF